MDCLYCGSMTFTLAVNMATLESDLWQQNLLGGQGSPMQKGNALQVYDKR